MTDLISHGEAEDGLSAPLRDNFRRYMGTRTVARLRQEMAEAGLSIGTSAIQMAKQGSTGVRLGTLEKFARFFACDVADLVGHSRTVSASWPFKVLTPAEFAMAPEGVKEAAERLLLAIAGRSNNS